MRTEGLFVRNGDVRYEVVDRRSSSRSLRRMRAKRCCRLRPKMKDVECSDDAVVVAPDFDSATSAC
jgi:hypothetical protein